MAPFYTYPETTPNWPLANSIAVRAQDETNMIVFSWTSCDSAWEIVEGGTRKTVPNSAGDFIGNEIPRIAIIVEGDQFTAQIGNETASSFIDSRFANGGVVLILKRNETVDNFVVEAIEE